MSWKLRLAGWNRGKKRIYSDDGSYFYDDPSKYPPEESQYTKKQLKELEELDRREKELEEKSRRLQIKIEKNELKIQGYQQKYKQLEREEKIQKRMYRELRPNYKHLYKDELMVMCHPDIDLKVYILLDVDLNIFYHLYLLHNALTSHLLPSIFTS